MKPYRPPTAETLVKNGIKRLLSAAGFFHFYNLQGTGVYKGITDLTAVDHREPYRGRIICIEVKSPRGKAPSWYQQQFMDRIKAAGGIAFVARSVEDVIEALGLQDRFRMK